MNEREIFVQALQFADAGEQAAFLDRACGPNQPLRQQVADLLSAHARAQSFLEVPPSAIAREPGPTTAGTAAERPGTQIGPYKLLQVIGEGGMGVVYMAEQTEPVERRVALKIIKPGMDSRQVIARFEAERQALAVMDHPNIAKIFDAGMTGEEQGTRGSGLGTKGSDSKGLPSTPIPESRTPSSGRPFFVMELVKGVPITKYCDEKHLSLKERLALMIPVCQAIQHAHQKGIIHRDIKPTNVLIAQYDGKPVPKVIDFGVAKATAQKLTERTMFTELGQIVGTLEYMSPEQAELNQLDIDTRSDIYSLGVLLYELLTGSTPFDRRRLHSAAFDEMRRIIREEEPPKPSTKLSTIDTLPSVAANRSVEPARLSKAVKGELDWIVMKTLEKDRSRRYETSNGLAGDIQRYLADEPVQACPPSTGYRFRKFARRNKRTLTAAALITVVLIAGTVISTWQAVRATRAEALAHELLIKERDAREQVIAAKTHEAEQRAQSSAAVEADLAAAARFQAESNCPQALAVVRQAEASLVGGSEELRQRLRARVRDLEKIVLLEDIRLLRRDEMSDSTDYHQHTDQDYTEAFREFGVEEAGLTAADVAERLRRTSVAVELAAAVDHWTTARKYLQPKDGWQRLQAIARAADPDPWRNQYRDTMNQRVGRIERLKDLADSATVESLPSQTLVLLAWHLGNTGNHTEAAALLERAWLRHPDDFWITDELSRQLFLCQPRREEEGFRYKTVAVALRPQSAPLRTSLGHLMKQSGRLEEGITQFREAVRLQPEGASAHVGLGVGLLANGQVDEGIASLREALRIKPDDSGMYRHLGEALLEKGEREAAIAAYRKAVELHPKDPTNHHFLGNALSRTREWEGAIAAYREAVRLQPGNAGHHAMLGRALKIKGLFDQALDSFRKAVELKPEEADYHHSLGDVLIVKGDLEAAIAAYRKAVQLQPGNAGHHVNLATALRSKGLLDEAVACFRKAVELKPDAAGYHTLLAHALLAKGVLDEAIVCYRMALQLQPDSAFQHAHLGRALQAKGLLDEAIECFRKAVELQPNEAGHYTNLGGAFQAKGRLDDAIDCFRKALQLNPKYELARWSLALVLVQDQKFAAGIAVYREAIVLHPDSATPYNNLAWLLATCSDPTVRDPATAVILARRAIELAPKASGQWNTLGVALYRAGDYSAAVEALHRSIEQLGETACDTFFLAMAHWQLDHKDEARRWYDQAALWMEKNKPQNEELKRFRTEAEELMKKNPEARSQGPGIRRRLRSRCLTLDSCSLFPETKAAGEVLPSRKALTGPALPRRSVCAPAAMAFLLYRGPTRRLP